MTFGFGTVFGFGVTFGAGVVLGCGRVLMATSVAAGLGMGETLTYREAATRVKRSIRSINRWRRQGMPMGWEIRDGQRVRVVDETTLLAWWRERLTAWPPHQYRLRKLLADDDTRHAE